MRIEHKTTPSDSELNGWWITGTPPGIDEMGPYDSRKEAAEDMAGLKRFIKEEAE